MKKIAFLSALAISLNVSAQQFDFYGPRPFGEILETTFNQSWTPSAISSIDNKKYVVILDEATKTKAISLNAADFTKVDLVSTADLTGSTSTYDSMLRGIFQLVDNNTHQENDPAGGSGTYTPLSEEYRVKPFLHSYFALNVASDDALSNTDAGTYFVEDAATNGYVLIEFTGTASSATLSAISQWTWNTSSGVFEENSSWTQKWLKIDNSDLVWTTSAAEATAFFLADANALIDLEIEDGSDFNPESTEYQPNKTAEIPEGLEHMENSKLVIDFETKLSNDYTSQLGSTASASTAASAKLDEIESTLTDNDASLRYPKEFYLALRENMLSHTIASNDIYGAILGHNTVPHVYFTNAEDDFGVPHPFMVIAAFATSTRPNQLLDVNRPPGATPGAGYAESEVTRNGKIGDFLVKIPLKDYGLISSLLDNDLEPFGDLVSDFDENHGSTTTHTVYNHTGLSSAGMAVDGVSIYPAQNNNLRFAVEDAEVTNSGIHVGGGLELHYHADGHAFTGNGINLYNLADYTGKNHPPVIGMAYDGIALFGRYESSHSSMVGYGVALDEFGGHDHGDGFGYHYHAHSQSLQSEMGTNFNEHFLLVGAWKGDINSIPGFDEGKTDQFNNESIARYVGAEYTPAPDGVSETVGEHEIVLYPNPGTGTFKVEVDQSYTLFVYSIDGRLVTTATVDETTQTLSLETLPAGIYSLRWQGAQSEFTSKLVIE